MVWILEQQQATTSDHEKQQIKRKGTAGIVLPFCIPQSHPSDKQLGGGTGCDAGCAVR
jgi:hypothetical protein